MSSNLTNVYAYLRRTFEDVDMIFSKPVSYIKTLAGVQRNEKIVLVFKEVNLNFRIKINKAVCLKVVFIKRR